MPWPRSGRKPKDSQENPVSDAQLAERLKRRDEIAFLQLYDLHRGAVYRFLMHMTGSIALAEELTQDVFVVVLDSISTGAIGHFDPQKGTLEGYLLGIARNLTRAERRRTDRLVSLDGVLEAPELDRILEGVSQKIQSWDVSATLAVRSELRLLYRAILELPEHYREAVVLCGLQEKSYRDAAVILQCSEGTIASRMNRAKALLAAKLQRASLGSENKMSILEREEGGDVRRAVKANGN